MKNLLTILFLLAGLNLQAQVYNETLGDRAGNDITTGDYNVVIGDAAGRTLSFQSENVIIGYRACVGTLDVTDGGDGASDEITTADCRTTDSVIIGYHAGRESTFNDDNVIIGYQAGQFNRASDATFVGYRAGWSNTTGYDNVFLGEEAGYYNSTGFRNVFVGEDAGFENSTGTYNTAFGSKALTNNGVSHFNTGIGNEAGYDIGGVTIGFNATRNTLVGNVAGNDIGNGIGNTCLGSNACQNTEHSDFNTFVGLNAGSENNRNNNDNINIGQRNTGLGTMSGFTNREGSDNVWIGAFSDSGRYLPNYNHNDFLTATQSTFAKNYAPGSFPISSNESVHRTTVMGSFASAGDDDSIAIGYNSRADNTNSISIGNNTFAIFTNSIAIGNNAIAKADNTIVIGNDSHTEITANADSTTALGSAAYRYADVVTNQVSINATTGTAARLELAADSGTGNDDVWTLSAADGGDFSIASFATGTDVNLFSINNTGDATLAGDLTLNSDRRLKTDIQSIENALALISDLQGKTYHWKDPSRGRDKHYGLIAQEVEAYMPELVGEDDQGMKTVNYQGIVPVLISAVNQSQQEKKQLENRVLSLEEKLERQAQMIQELMDRME